VIKSQFSASLLQSSVSHDPSEIIIIWWFEAHFGLLLSMLKTVLHFFFFWKRHMIHF